MQCGDRRPRGPDSVETELGSLAVSHGGRCGPARSHFYLAHACARAVGPPSIVQSPGSSRPDRPFARCLRRCLLPELRNKHLSWFA